MEENIQEIYEELEFLKWQIELLRKNVKCDDYSQQLLSLGLTRDEKNDFENYVNNFVDTMENGEDITSSMYEHIIMEVTNKLNSSKDSELLLKCFVITENQEHYYDLFKKLYGKDLSKENEDKKIY